MRLQRLKINRLPGINVPFEITSAGEGFHVVFGPNGIGKSSLCRAIEGLYWSDRSPTQQNSVIGEFELDGDAWRAEREGTRVRWQRNGEDSAPPSLPSSYHHNCFFLRLRDLIDPSPEGTRDVAYEIRRQMSGGIDLDKVVSDLFDDVGVRHGRRERREFDKASQKVQEAEGEHIGLQRRADKLSDLEAELAAAGSSATRVALVERALGLAERRKALAQVVDELSALPKSLANLTGKEVEQIDDHQRQIKELDGRIGELGTQLARARQDQSDAGLKAPLESAQLNAWRENVQELNRVEVELKAARVDYSGHREALGTALSAVGGSNIDEVKLDLADHGQLFDFLRSVENHRGKVNVVKERLRLLASVELPKESQRDLEQIRGSVEALRSWLRAPAPESISGDNRARWVWMLVAAGLIAIGGLLAALVDAVFSLLSAVGIGIALPILIWRGRKSRSDVRQLAQNEFRKFSVDGPETWEMPSVESRLRELEAEAAILDAQMQRARDRDVERQSLKNDLEGLSEAKPELDARRQRLQDSLKLDDIPPDAELVDLARALDQLRSAQSKEQIAAGKLRELEQRHTKLLSDLAGVLERHGEMRPKDAATAVASFNQLSDRDSKLREAISTERTTTRQLEQFSADRGKALESIEQIYTDAALDKDDLNGLVTLLGSLPRYRELKNESVRLESQIELDQDELGNAGEGDLGQLDKLALDQLHADLSRAALRATELRDEIADINAQVNAARQGHNIQDLIAARDDTLTKLQDRQNEALYAKAGRLLIDSVEQEYEQTQMPHVLERARGLFSAFTHHNYELRLGTGGEESRLIAIDLRSREGQGLDELSDGTRAQLLLAARIAFAEEVEQGRALPLFLDEALDQSDPARYEAIVCSLGRVAKDQGRQIFYLTSDPADVGRVQDALAKEKCDLAAAIDLGLVRTNEASVSGPGALHVEPRPPVLSPGGLSADEYGAALGVPALDPALGYAYQHFFHVLWDDLELLHAFLTHGIERVGQWETVSESALAVKLGGHAVSTEEITLRSNLLEIFCELWNQGRGRPVDREALVGSGAVSGRFLDDVAVIANELGGDPERLLDTLRSREDPRLKGFRASSLQNLERYLGENGYVDDQPVLKEEELRLRALASPAANRLPEGAADACLNRWWTLAERTLTR